MLSEMLQRFGNVEEKISVRTVFGEAIQRGGRTIIPVASVTYAFGFGGGRQSPSGVGSTASRTGEGGGGGGRASVRPVALLEVDLEGTRVRPIVDMSRLALAGMALVAWNVFWVSLTVRRLAERRGPGGR
jgi:uncharacterized spore protein YtfJ